MSLINKIVNKIWVLSENLYFIVKYPKARFIRSGEYGSYYSQDGQDLLTSALLFPLIERNREMTKNVVDVGCNHPVNFSNSYYFEKYYDCNVLAIDMIDELETLWNTHRPKATYLSTAVGNNDEYIDVNIPKYVSDYSTDTMYSYVDGGTEKRSDIEFTNKKVKMSKLCNIFRQYNMDTILMLSIDIEGFEYEALKGINFNEVRILCIVIENNSSSRYGSSDVREFLVKNNYALYARIANLDDIFIHNSMLRGD